jgi:hypothetical protein
MKLFIPVIPFDDRRFLQKQWKSPAREETSARKSMLAAAESMC